MHAPRPSASGRIADEGKWNRFVVALLKDAY